jgi:hypothetical protein
VAAILKILLIIIQLLLHWTQFDCLLCSLHDLVGANSAKEANSRLVKSKVHGQKTEPTKCFILSDLQIYAPVRKTYTARLQQQRKVALPGKQTPVKHSCTEAGLMTLYTIPYIKSPE